MRWNAGTAVVFRFAVVYLGLFSLATQIVGSLILVPGLSFRGFGALWPMRSITAWIAENVVGIEAPLAFSPVSGETVAFWIQTAWIFAFAVFATLVWTLAGRNGSDYSRAHDWFRLFVRLALAGQLFEYGITKIIPNQFEAPSLSVLVTPTGDLSLNTLLWSTIGSSPGYQIFTGWAELVAGVLLIVPGTVLLGALIALADMLHVFALNMAFDIGLKLTTLHLIVLALVLVAPDARRLVRFFVENREVSGPSRESWRGSPAVRTAVMVFGVYLIGMQVWANVNFWYSDGGGAPRSAFYGIWDVEEITVSGVTRPAVLNDYDRRWRRLIFDDAGEMAIQRTDDSFARFAASIDEEAGTLELKRPASPANSSSSALFQYSPDEPGRLLVEGVMDGLPVRAVLRRRNEDTFRLLNSGFRWIRPDAD